ncbi:hypothetical protein D9M71_171770 [compost metagenome]
MGAIEIDLAVGAIDQCCTRCCSPRLVQVDAINGGAGVEQHTDTGAGVLLVVVTDPAQVEGFAGLVQQLGAKAVTRTAVEVMAVEFVLDIAVAAGPVSREAASQLFTERPGNRALGLEVAIFADRRFDTAFRGETRCTGADIDHPGGGVLTEQCALGASQHLQLFDVHQVENRHPGPAEVDVVDVQADAAFQAITGRVVAQTANRHAGLARMHVGNVDAGHQLLQVLDLVDALAFQGLAINDAHRRGYALRAFFAAAGSHGHSLELRVGAAGGHHGGCLPAASLWLVVCPCRGACQQQCQWQALEPPWEK